MLGKSATAGLVVTLAVVVLGACAEDGEGGENDTTSASPAVTQTPLERAKDALLTADEIPVPPPSTTVELPSSYTAEDDQVSAPWPQFTICSSVGKPDERPSG